MVQTHQRKTQKTEGLLKPRMNYYGWFWIILKRTRQRRTIHDNQSSFYFSNFSCFLGFFFNSRSTQLSSLNVFNSASYLLSTGCLNLYDSYESPFFIVDQLSLTQVYVSFFFFSVRRVGHEGLSLHDSSVVRKQHSSNR